MKLKNFRKTMNRFPYFIIFLSVYPGLSLLATNIREVDPLVAVRPAIFFIIISMIIYLFHLLVIKDHRRTSILTAFSQVFIFNYGQFFNIINEIKIVELSRNGMHILLVAIILLAYMIIFKTSRNRFLQTFPLTIISLSLFILPIIQLGQYYRIRSVEFISTSEENRQALYAEERPDIYYIILDEYTRADVLSKLGYDNSPFLDSLQTMGFQIADCARSNYTSTPLTLASTLNMEYIWEFVPHDGPLDDNSQPIFASITHNRVIQDLKGLGYKIVSFPTGFQWADFENEADFYIETGEGYLFSPYIFSFEYMLLENTILKVALDNGFLEHDFIRFREHYERTHFVLDTLPKLDSLPGPKFVLAHILVPHDPYVFLPDGSINPDPSYYLNNAEGYINNVKFINSEIEIILRDIIDDSEIPPIIIIQGDHGIKRSAIEEERYFILNAYYLPGPGEGAIYSKVSPINNFRGIFNIYFGAGYPLKNDDSIVADIGYPYRDKIKIIPKKDFPCPSNTSD